MNSIKIGKVLAESFGKHRPFTLRTIVKGSKWGLDIEPSAKAKDDWRYNLANALWVYAKRVTDGASTEYILTYEPYN